MTEHSLLDNPTHVNRDLEDDFQMSFPKAQLTTCIMPSQIVFGKISKVRSVFHQFKRSFSVLIFPHAMHT